MTTLVSCSSFNIFEGDSVPKEKYEQLLDKYKTLVGKKLPKPQNTSVAFVDDHESVQEFRSRLNQATDRRSIESRKYDMKRVQKDISLLYQAYSKYRNKEYGDVIIILKELENSQVDKVRAQARYLLAITMLDQGELDLSMQIFEEIVLTMRNSAFALMSLEHLISNTKKLGLIKKHEYFSQLYARFLK